MHLPTVDPQPTQDVANLLKFSPIFLNVLNLERPSIEFSRHSAFGIKVTAHIRNLLTFGGEEKRIVVHIEEISGRLKNIHLISCLAFPVNPRGRAKNTKQVLKADEPVRSLLCDPM